MRAAGGAVRRYVAGPVPDGDLHTYLRNELAKIQNALQVLADGQLDVTQVTPPKPRSGMIRYSAAGILGVGEGFYGYYAGGWKFLG